MDLMELNNTMGNEYLIKNIYDTFKQFEKEPTPNYFESDLKPLLNQLNDAISLILLSVGVPKHALNMVYLNAYNNISPKKVGHLDTQHRRAFKDGKTCAICGSKDNLTVHHIKKVKTHEHLAYNYNNMVVLCKECHTKQHTHILDLTEVMKESSTKYGGIIWNHHKNR